MKFNKLYEDIFKPASKEEAEKRKELGKMEYIEELLNKRKITYTKDKTGNIIKINKKDIDKKDMFGITVLQNEVIGNDITAARLLLKNGANPNIVLPLTQETLLNVAIINGNLEMVKLLLDNGADVNKENGRDIYPLELAYDYKDTNIINLLKQYGAKE